MGSGASNLDHCNTTNQLPEGVPEDTHWMAGVPDEASLASLSIPGTHCSHTYKTGRHQSLNIDQMLRAGIRFFDLEMRLDGNSRVMLWQEDREPETEDTLRSVAGPFVYFLQKFPSETILCCVTEAVASVGPGTFAEAFCRQIQEDVGDFLWTEPRLPDMGRARGKVVFLRNFSDGRQRLVPFGGVVSSSRSGPPKRNDTFWDAVQRDLERAEDGDPSLLHAVYTSHKGMRVKHACHVNAMLLDFLLTKGNVRLGIIATDFPGSGLVRAIVETNELKAVQTVAKIPSLNCKTEEDPAPEKNGQEKESTLFSSKQF